MDMLEYFLGGRAMATLEVEFKNLLTVTEYDELRQAYPFGQPFLQQNYYFDTPNRLLQQAHCGMRIRLFVDYAEQTLKVPAPIETAAKHQLYEITDRLTLKQAAQLLDQHQILTTGQSAAALTKYQISPNQLKLIGQGTTKRQIAKLPVGDLTLDRTYYPNDAQDFELELETTDPVQAGTFYQTLLQQHQIPQRPRVNKVARAVQEFEHDFKRN